jgi:hypothetical protein
MLQYLRICRGLICALHKIFRPGSGSTGAAGQPPLVREFAPTFPARVVVRLAIRDLQCIVRGYMKTIHRNVGVFLQERYRPVPELDRFFRTQ